MPGTKTGTCQRKSKPDGLVKHTKAHGEEMYQCGLNWAHQCQCVSFLRERGSITFQSLYQKTHSWPHKLSGTHNNLRYGTLGTNIKIHQKAKETYPAETATSLAWYKSVSSLIVVINDAAWTWHWNLPNAGVFPSYDMVLFNWDKSN